MDKTITVPNWVFQGADFVKHNFSLSVCVLVVAVIGSIITELLKHTKITPDEKKKLAKVSTYLYIVLTAFFSFLGYALVLAQANLSFLQSLPVIGTHTLEALGVGFTLYNIRLKGWYKTFTAWLKKNSDKPATTAESPSVVETPDPTQDAPFQPN